MSTELDGFDDLAAIRRYVTQTLCEKDHLEASFFPVSERLLTRGGAPCGIYFCLHGPRSLRLTAIWETDSNTIWFYGSRGERFRKTQWTATPAMDEAVAG